MGGEEESGFEPATGDGPPAPGDAAARAASVRSAWAGLVQIRRLANSGRSDPESVPAPWELHRPVRAVALALEAAGLPPSAVGPSGERTGKGYRVTEGAAPGTVRVEWLGPAGSGAAYEEESELPRCVGALRELGWTALLYRGPRGRRFLEVEPPAGRPDGR
ncbi:hypothetical protein [Streptomyces drozdowiczii]|uniref:Uncharacterized protein n=1 Tax=Streptomyces drozdowiczii TaxID=202862 RepID=A0ABY6PM88_9ACTN|nr:hypothetical protein [Streptomyces drozdowiczii]MCX0247709.1 hypothetical protein [Streptomyces drozdowiczii]UZK52921.1 hypothetical protein NEH16_01240 [Streptomyces drozdowiczii]